MATCEVVLWCTKCQTQKRMEVPRDQLHKLGSGLINQALLISGWLPVSVGGPNEPLGEMCSECFAKYQRQVRE